jgi:hypothetical protein
LNWRDVQALLIYREANVIQARYKQAGMAWS